jgi:hypothetical protein
MPLLAHETTLYLTQWLRQVKSFDILSERSSMSIRDSGETARLDVVANNNRDLANFLRDQLRIVLEMREQVLAIERLIQDTPSLKEPYAAHLLAVRSDPSVQPKPQWDSMVERLFAALSRQ